MGAPRPRPAPELARLRNLGPMMARALAEIGVRSEADLRRLGAVEAFRRIRATTPHQLTLNALYALAGALDDIDWRALDLATKQRLRREAGLGGAPAGRPGRSPKASGTTPG